MRTLTWLIPCMPHLLKGNAATRPDALQNADRPRPYLAHYKCVPGNVGTRYSADGCHESACTWSAPASKVPACDAGVVHGHCPLYDDAIADKLYVQDCYGCFCTQHDVRTPSRIAPCLHHMCRIGTCSKLYQAAHCCHGWEICKCHLAGSYMQGADLTAGCA